MVYLVANVTSDAPLDGQEAGLVAVFEKNFTAVDFTVSVFVVEDTAPVRRPIGADASGC